MSFSVSGKTAIVTGAASGLGLAIAHHLLDRGANVVFADMDETRLEDEIGAEARREGSLRLYSGDLTQKLGISNLVTTTIDAFERIDILVNGHRKFMTAEAMDPEADQVAELWQQNALSALRLTQMVAKRMGRIKPEENAPLGSQGSIINFSSLAAVRVQPDLLAYSMASAAVEQMTRTLAVVLAPQGVRVNAISIGSVMSASLQGVLRDSPSLRDPIERATPLGRIAAPDELVETVQYLASDASRFVTGQILAVDGGRSLLDASGVPAF